MNNSLITISNALWMQLGIFLSVWFIWKNTRESSKVQCLIWEEILKVTIKRCFFVKPLKFSNFVVDMWQRSNFFDQTPIAQQVNSMDVSWRPSNDRKALKPRIPPQFSKWTSANLPTNHNSYTNRLINSKCTIISIPRQHP